MREVPVVHRAFDLLRGGRGRTVPGRSSGRDTPGFEELALEFFAGVLEGEALAPYLVDGRVVEVWEEEVVFETDLLWLVFVAEVNFDWKIETSVTRFRDLIWWLLYNYTVRK